MRSTFLSIYKKPKNHVDLHTGMVDPPAAASMVRYLRVAANGTKKKIQISYLMTMMINMMLWLH